MSRPRAGLGGVQPAPRSPCPEGQACELAGSEAQEADRPASSPSGQQDGVPHGMHQGTGPRGGWCASGVQPPSPSADWDTRSGRGPGGRGAAGGGGDRRDGPGDTLEGQVRREDPRSPPAHWVAPKSHAVLPACLSPPGRPPLGGGPGTQWRLERLPLGPRVSRVPRPRPWVLRVRVLCACAVSVSVHLVG